MMLTKIFTLATLVSAAFASGDTIVAAFGVISTTASSLDDTVAAWDGSISGTTAIVTLANQLLSDTEDATDVANASAALSTTEALNVASATTSLSDVIEAALDTVVAAKSKFDALGISSVILDNLEQQKTAADTLSTAVIAKVPAALQSTAKALVQPILDAFDEAIAAYS